jgi:hypothetical protein
LVYVTATDAKAGETALSVINICLLKRKGANLIEGMMII